MNSFTLFFISPLLSFFSALKHPNKQYSVFAIIIMGCFIGYLYNTDNQGYDLYRYLELLKNSKGISEVWKNIKTGEDVDLYVPLSVSIISSFSKNGHILMMWFGAIFGILYSKGLSRFNNPKNILSYMFIFFFANIYGFNELAGVRFVTAFYVFFIGVTSYFETKHIKSIGVLLLSALIHFGFLPGIALFFCYLFLRKFPKVIYSLAIASFIFTIIDLGSVFSNVANFIGGEMASRAEIYNTENITYVDSLAEHSEMVVWFIRYRLDAAFFTIIAYLVVISLYRKAIKLDSHIKDLSLFVLLWITLRNMVYNIPDVGVRYTTILIAFSIYLAYNIYINDKSHSIFIKNISIVILAGCVLCPLYSIRQVFDYISFWDLLFPPIYGIVNSLGM